eukprot:CAMPEP_0171727732 /NCGR_PEP_ID=MMETSP0991-20121206/26501_1 /TAXON_ID=483369 /ORGANISM="non described non described, Strain CCMP2098" /LENGTH=416 /DNA_ID=CAMNT_0012321591 /DNA_START=75 /DNA_END=1328 /DNA_ORIENTATION=+
MAKPWNIKTLEYLGFALIACTVASYLSQTTEHGVPFQLRAVSGSAKLLSTACGMRAEGSGTSLLGEPWRQCWERFRPLAPTGASDGVTSTDVEVPASGNLLTPFQVRVYTPDLVEGEDVTSLLPVLVYFHGGGFTIGHYNDEDYDDTLRQLSSEGNWVVVSVEYPLAPEHPFPAGLRACAAALEWVAASASTHVALARVDVRQLIVGGDSAGGNFAAVVAILNRDGLDADLNNQNTASVAKTGVNSAEAVPSKTIAIAHQLLVYPLLYPSEPTASSQRLLDAYFINKQIMDFFAAAYFFTSFPSKNLVEERQRQHALERSDFRVSPFLAPGGLHSLPPTTLITTSLDPLLDEGLAYVKALRAAGIAVEHHNYETLPHGFWQAAKFCTAKLGIAERDRALSAAVSAVNKALWVSQHQ